MYKMLKFWSKWCPKSLKWFAEWIFLLIMDFSYSFLKWSACLTNIYRRAITAIHLNYIGMLQWFEISNFIKEVPSQKIKLMWADRPCWICLFVDSGIPYFIFCGSFCFVSHNRIEDVFFGKIYFKIVTWKSRTSRIVVETIIVKHNFKSGQSFLFFILFVCYKYLKWN